jgi:hypothetical protein
MELKIIVLNEIRQTTKTNITCFLLCVEFRRKDMKVEGGQIENRKRTSGRGICG